ncbi:MAG: hypothetical protein K2Q26_02045 [Bdellovibrionales bacterium]|nr:hypothetical protein [Bdellovibrionales bacterium]
MQSFRIVLVRPKYARNVGMVARAMANYGLEHLILIDPQCEMDIEAHEGAAGGQGPLEKIQIYPSWQRFYDWEHEGMRIAFSRREGQNRESFPFATRLKTDSEFTEQMFNKVTYFIFGPEDHGLSEEDLNFVHFTTYLELPGEVKSMNLSHAVCTVLTLCHQHLPSRDEMIAVEHQERLEKFFFPDQSLRRWIEALNIDISTHNRVNAYTILKKLLLKGVPNQKELRILEKVMQQTVRKLRDRSDKEKDSKDNSPSVTL